MSIETICQKCARKLRVADQYAGKKARCPQCGTIYVVPGSRHPFQWKAETIYHPQTEAEKWRVRTPDGRVYGPVPKSELDQWVQEGRIPPEAVLQPESLDDLASGIGCLSAPAAHRSARRHCEPICRTAFGHSLPGTDRGPLPATPSGCTDPDPGHSRLDDVSGISHRWRGSWATRICGKCAAARWTAAACHSHRPG